jgi:hypothetical protein
MSIQSGGKAEEFFNRLDGDLGMQAKIKQGLEKLAKDVGYNVTEEELNAELRKRWDSQGGAETVYSEPPGF